MNIKLPAKVKRELIAAQNDLTEVKKLCFAKAALLDATPIMRGANQKNNPINLGRAALKKEVEALLMEVRAHRAVIMEIIAPYQRQLKEATAALYDYSSGNPTRLRFPNSISKVSRRAVSRKSMSDDGEIAA